MAVEEFQVSRLDARGQNHTAPWLLLDQGKARIRKIYHDEVPLLSGEEEHEG